MQLYSSVYPPLEKVSSQPHSEILSFTMSSLNPSPSTTSLVTNSDTTLNASTDTLIPKVSIRLQTALYDVLSFRQSKPGEGQAAGSSSANTSTDAAITTPTPPQKDYEASFAQLSSSFGFGGMAPTKPRKKNKGKKPASGSLMNLFKSRSPTSDDQGGQGEGGQSGQGGQGGQGSSSVSSNA